MPMVGDCVPQPKVLWYPVGIPCHTISFRGYKATGQAWIKVPHNLQTSKNGYLCKVTS